MDSADPERTADLIAALRDDAPSIDAAARARLRDRIALSVGLAGPTGPESSIEQLAGASATAAKGGGTLLALGFAIGTGVGALGHALVASPVERIVYRDRIVEVKAPSAAPATSATELAAAEPPPASTPEQKSVAGRPIAPASASTAAEPPHVDEGLSAELGLLDEARKALGAGDANRALYRLKAHAERYPGSRLEQEREALSVKALIGAGRHAEARALGERFRQRFPKSMLLDSVEKALASIP